MFKHRAFAVALVSVLAVPSARAGAPSADVTGTWQATFSCKAVSFEGEIQKSTTVATVQNSQVGSKVYGQFVLEAPASSSAGPRGTLGTTGPLCGLIVDIAAKPGRARLNYTVGSGPYAVEVVELPIFPGTVDLSVTVGEANAKGISGKMTGTALYDFIGTALVGGGLGSCKVKMERVSTDAPSIDPAVLDVCDLVYDAVLP
jgi:hypothetical protein